MTMMIKIMTMMMMILVYICSVSSEPLHVYLLQSSHSCWRCLFSLEAFSIEQKVRVSLCLHDNIQQLVATESRHSRQVNSWSPVCLCCLTLAINSMTVYNVYIYCLLLFFLPLLSSQTSPQTSASSLSISRTSFIGPPLLTPLSVTLSDLPPPLLTHPALPSPLLLLHLPPSLYTPPPLLPPGPLPPPSPPRGAPSGRRERGGRRRRRSGSRGRGRVLLKHQRVWEVSGGGASCSALLILS